MVFPLIIWFIAGALVLIFLGGFSLFALFNLNKAIGLVLIISALFMLQKSGKKPWIPIGLILLGLFLALK